MSEPNAFEQYQLELINQERAAAGAQPLAFDLTLNNAAEQHSLWMLAADVFEHTGSGGSSPSQRMTAAGYALTGAWSTGENIAWASLRSPTGYQDEVLLLHTNLMNSPGHRANILNDTFREVGIGFEIGEFQGWQAAMVSQDFAKTGTANFLTGVAFDDQDGDHAYDPGEGLAGLSVSVAGAGGAYATTTYGSGGYELSLPNGTYTVTFSGGGFATVSQQVTISGRNVKVDLVDPATGGGTPTPPVSGQPIVGTAASEILTGGAGPDTINGGAGADTIDGGAGTSYLRGDDGNDRITGGGDFDDINGNVGNDTASGGDGADWVVGGKDQDLLSGDAGNDIVYGNLGDDTCDGGTGDDIVRGGQDNDILTGGAGNDWLSGDRGSDTVSGGAGADIFHSFSGAGLDRVLDFSLAQGDRVMLDAGTAYTVVQSGADTVIDMGGGDQMVLVGVSMTSLTGDWLFLG
jgi:Ca2+-binding RTX toxin-like protein